MIYKMLSLGWFGLILFYTYFLHDLDKRKHSIAKNTERNQNS